MSETRLHPVQIPLRAYFCGEQIRERTEPILSKLDDGRLSSRVAELHRTSTAHGQDVTTREVSGFGGGRRRRADPSPGGTAGAKPD